MNNMIELAKQQVKETVMNALGRLVAEGKIEAVPLPAFNVERPADVSHGDFSCNAAMASAKALKNNPRAIGQMIADAVERGCRHIMVGLGGSATTDAGTGMLQALGWRFIDAHGNELEGCGLTLAKIHTIIAPPDINTLRGVRFTAMCDVDNPLYGPRGAAHVFAPQKGADARQVELLDAGLRHFVKVCQVTSPDSNSRQEMPRQDMADKAGDGAAGGLGFAMRRFLGAGTVSGIDAVLDIAGFDTALQGAALVITGEGRLDDQTLAGKAPAGILRRARRAGVPVAAIGGTTDPAAKQRLLEAGFATVTAATPADLPLAQALQANVAAANLRAATAKQLADFWARMYG